MLPHEQTRKPVCQQAALTRPLSHSMRLHAPHRASCCVSPCHRRSPSAIATRTASHSRRPRVYRRRANPRPTRSAAHTTLSLRRAVSWNDSRRRPARVVVAGSFCDVGMEAGVVKWEAGLRWPAGFSRIGSRMCSLAGRL